MKSCRQHLTQQICMDVFELTYDRMRRYQGDWHVEKLSLFPDYFFIESMDEAGLRDELEQYKTVFYALGAKDVLIPVGREEEAFLQKICDRSHHLGMSRGVIRDGRTWVTEGPLKEKEFLIQRIDRHKRIARVRIPDAGNKREMVLGLEIVGKSLD